MGKLNLDGTFRENLEILLAELGDEEVSKAIRDHVDIILTLAPGNSSVASRAPIMDAFRELIAAAARKEHE